MNKKNFNYDLIILIMTVILLLLLLTNSIISIVYNTRSDNKKETKQSKHYYLNNNIELTTMEIKDETIDGDNAVVKVAITVRDYSGVVTNAESYRIDNREEFTDENGNSVTSDTATLTVTG